MTNKTNKTNTKGDFTEFDGRVGQAWSLHFRKQYDAAVEKYRQLLDEWPDHVDANYGLALSYKMLGQKDKAVEWFKKTRKFIESEITKANGESSRWQMLLRMVDQHLAALS